MKSMWIDYKGQRMMVCDYSNFRSDTEALKTEVASLFKSAAVVRVPGIVNVLIQAFAKATGLPFRLFEDVDSAKDWLVD